MAAWDRAEPGIKMDQSGYPAAPHFESKGLIIDLDGPVSGYIDPVEMIHP